MNLEYAHALARYHAKRSGSEAARTEALVDRMLADLHPKQRAFVEDNTSPVKAARCGRRAGKSTGIGSNLFIRGLTAPRAFSCYIAPTSKGAKKLMWPELTRINEHYRIGARPNSSDLTFTLPNNHTIFLGGVDTRSEIEKFRSYKYAFAAADECGSMGPWLRELVVDILEPACLDVNGQIAMNGTPGPVCDGFFWESTTPGHDESVPTYHWTCLDNPFIPGAHAWLAATKKRRGWDDNHPTYLREWMGIWVPDTNAMCFPAFTLAANADWDGHLPDLHGTSKWEYILAIDVGYDDASSFTLIADARTSDTAYVTQSYKETRMTISQVFQRARDICATKPVRRIVVDASGGGGKNIVEDWKPRFSMPLTAPPNKKAKRDHIALVNNAFSDRKLVVHAEKCADLVHEMGTVCWDDKRKKPDPRYPNDCTDGLEYGYMQSYHFAGKPPEKPTAQLTREERIAREEEEHERRAVKRVRREQRRSRRVAF